MSKTSCMILPPVEVLFVEPVFYPFGRDSENSLQTTERESGYATLDEDHEVAVDRVADGPGQADSYSSKRGEEVCLHDDEGEYPACHFGREYIKVVREAFHVFLPFDSRYGGLVASSLIRRSAKQMVFSKGLPRLLQANPFRAP